MDADEAALLEAHALALAEGVDDHRVLGARGLEEGAGALAAGLEEAEAPEGGGLLGDLGLGLIEDLGGLGDGELLLGAEGEEAEPPGVREGAVEIDPGEGGFGHGLGLFFHAHKGKR